MDDQQTTPNKDNADSTDETGQLLPPVQAQSATTDDNAADDRLSPQTVPTGRALVPVPEEAADSDLIEKEWVLKAKQIVEHTSDDPYSQQEELSKMKTEYIKKRYNKEIGSAY